MGDSPQDQTARVRAGYNLLSRAYRADTADGATQRQYAEWLGPVLDRAPAGEDVLDLGCGNGLPASKWLPDSGLKVTGVDLSGWQVAALGWALRGNRRAHRLVGHPTRLAWWWRPYVLEAPRRLDLPRLVRAGWTGHR